jgi:hypothetical protein
MAKNTKIVRKGFEYRSCDDFAAYLNHMARQGWHFTGWRAGLVFEKGEPEDAVYTVEIFSGASEYDTRPEPNTKEFADYCEAAGWQFIDSTRKFVVFKRVREDAVPIMTEEERLESIVKATSKEIWQPVIFSGFWVLMRIWNFSISFRREIYSDFSLMFMAIFTVTFVASLLRCVQFYLWKSRCQKRLEDGKHLFFGKGRQTFEQRWYLWVDYALIATMFIVASLKGYIGFVLIPIIAVGLILIPIFFTAHKRPDAATNQITSILYGVVGTALVLVLTIFFVERESRKEKVLPQPPLTYADMGIDLELVEVSAVRQQQSILGSWQYFSLDYGDDSLYYQIFSADGDWVLDQLWDEETDGRVNETREDCTADWGALEAFRNSTGTYLVRYEDAFWVISYSLDQPLNQDQIDTIIAALKEG